MAMRQRADGGDRWRLRRQVTAACGPATQFSPIELQLAEWVESGEYASQASRAAVEPYLAGYLQSAADAGHRWGRRVGIGAGVLLGMLVFAIVLAVR